MPRIYHRKSTPKGDVHILVEDEAKTKPMPIPGSKSGGLAKGVGIEASEGENLCPPREGLQHPPLRTEATLIASNRRIPVVNMVKLLLDSSEDACESAGLIVQRVYRVPMDIESDEADANGNHTQFTMDGHFANTVCRIPMPACPVTPKNPFRDIQLAKMEVINLNEVGETEEPEREIDFTDGDLEALSDALEFCEGALEGVYDGIAQANQNSNNTNLNEI